MKRLEIECSTPQVKLILDDINNVLNNHLGNFFVEKNAFEKMLLNMPYVQNIVKENDELKKENKNLKRQHFENNIENAVDSKLELEICEIPKNYIDITQDLDEKVTANNVKRNATEVNASLSLWGINYASTSEEDSEDDEELDNTYANPMTQQVNLFSNTRKKILINEDGDKKESFGNLLNNLAIDVKKVNSYDNLLNELNDTKKIKINNEFSVFNEESHNEEDEEDDEEITNICNNAKQEERLEDEELEEEEEQEEDEEDEEDEEEDQEDEDEEDEDEEEEEEDEELEEEEEDEELEEEEEDEELEEEEEDEELEEEEEDEELEEEEEEEDEELEEDEEDDEEYDVEEIELSGIKYYTTDLNNGIIFEFLENEDIGEELGKLQNGVLFLS